MAKFDSSAFPETADPAEFYAVLVPRVGLGDLLVAALPLLFGAALSALGGWYVTEIAQWLFGGTPHGLQGYLLLALVLLPLLVSLVATEWRLTNWHVSR